MKKAKKIEVRRCLVCEIDISHKRSQAIYCSKAHAHVAFTNTNKDRLNAERRVANQADPELMRARQRVYGTAWRKNNPEKAKAHSAKKRAKHPERTRQQARDSYYRNREARLEMQKAIRDRDPERFREAGRRCRKKAAETLQAYKLIVASLPSLLAAAAEKGI